MRWILTREEGEIWERGEAIYQMGDRICFSLRRCLGEKPARQTAAWLLSTYVIMTVQRTLHV